MKYDKIIFVCTGNTCRSPMAEMLMKYKLGAHGITSSTIDVISRGLCVYGADQLNPRVYITLLNHDLPPENFKSLRISEDEITPDTLVLTMNENQSSQLRCLIPDINNLYTLGEFTGKKGEVEKPVSGPPEAYERVYEQLDELTDIVLAELLKDEICTESIA